MKPHPSSQDKPAKATETIKQPLNGLVNSKHPLVILSQEIQWQTFDETFGGYYSDLGRPGVSTRLMVALHYLKYQHDLSDEAVVAQWIENPYWQYFSGMIYFEHELPIDPSSMTNWRKRSRTASQRDFGSRPTIKHHQSQRIRASKCRHNRTRETHSFSD